MAKNLFGKTNLNDPYAIYEDARTGWRWEVLKTYKTRASEDKDQHSRWFVKAYSPFCPEGEMGDTYRRDIVGNGLLVSASPEWREAYA